MSDNKTKSAEDNSTNKNKILGLIVDILQGVYKNKLTRADLLALVVGAFSLVMVSDEGLIPGSDNDCGSCDSLKLEQLENKVNIIDQIVDPVVVDGDTIGWKIDENLMF